MTKDEDESTAALRSSSRPWKGIFLTFTGVENKVGCLKGYRLIKVALAALAQELGALIDNALTVEVTHVIASGFGSPKYMVCLDCPRTEAVRLGTPNTHHVP